MYFEETVNIRSHHKGERGHRCDDCEMEGFYGKQLLTGGHPDAQVHTGTHTNTHSEFEMGGTSEQEVDGL